MTPPVVARGDQHSTAARLLRAGMRVAGALAIWTAFVALRQVLAGYIALPPVRLPYRPGTVIPDGHTASFTWVVTHHLWISVYWPAWLLMAVEGVVVAAALVAAYPAGPAIAGRIVLSAMALFAALAAVGCCGIGLPGNTLAILFDNLSPLAPWANGGLFVTAATLVGYGYLGGRISTWRLGWQAR